MTFNKQKKIDHEKKTQLDSFCTIQLDSTNPGLTVWVLSSYLVPLENNQKILLNKLLHLTVDTTNLLFVHRYPSH